MSRAEATKYLGLKHVKNAETDGLDKEMWELYLQYRELFQLETPFQPDEHLIANNLEEHSWADLPSACIESLERADICQKTVRVRRLRNVPPTLNVNLSNLALPPLNIANLPEGIDQQQLNILVQQVVQASVQQCLNAAAKSAVENLLKALPQVGFEHITFNSGWKTER
jgi:hypothetical protein